MEVYLRWTLTSEEVGVEVGEFDTIGQFRENAAQEFGCDVEHVELHMDGVSIGDDEELVSAATSLTHASVVDVVVSMDVFVKHIRNGTRSYTDLPESVQSDIPCALAALGSDEQAFRHLPPEVQTHPTIVEHVASSLSSDFFEAAHPSAWNDEDFRSAVLTATNGRCLSWDCCEELRSDRDKVFACVKRDGMLLEFASNELKKCPVIVLASVQCSPSAIQYAAEEVRADQDIFTAAVVGGVRETTWLPEALRADRGLALRCVERSCSALCVFSDELKADRFVVATAGSLEFASEDLKKDRDFVISFMAKGDGINLSFVDESLQSDKDVVMAAISRTASAFRYACNSFRDDPELALRCTIYCPQVASHYGSTLCLDKDFIMSAVREKGADVFYHLKEQWKDDEDVARLAIEASATSFRGCSATLRDNRAFVLFAIQKGAKLHDASPALQSDAEMCRAAGQDIHLHFAPQALRDDFEFVKKAVSTQGSDLQYASPALQDSYDIVLAAVRHSGEGFLYASPRLRKCEELAREALGHMHWQNRNGCWQSCSYNILGTYLLDDKAFILSIAKPDVISRVSKRLRADRDVVLSCVQHNGSCLSYASSDLRDDRAVVEAAIASNEGAYHSALQSASLRLRRDHSLVLFAVTHRGDFLQYASGDLQSNIDIVRAAVAQDWSSLQYASISLLHATDFLRSVLPEHPRALQYASAEVRNDVSFVAPLVEKDVYCLSCAGPAVLSDRAVILSAVRQWPGALQYASHELRNDPDIAAALIEHEHPSRRHAVSLLNPEVLGNKDFMTKAITKQASWFLDASVRLQNDPDLVLLAVGKEPHLIKHAGAEVRGDYNTMLEVVTKWSNTLEHASKALRNNLDIVTAAVVTDPLSFKYASAAVRNCKRVAMLAVRGSTRNWKYASEALQNDPDVVLECCVKEPRSIAFAGPIKDNYHFAVKAVRQQQRVFERLSLTLRTNPNFILACITYENRGKWKPRQLGASAWAHKGLVMRLLPVFGGETVMMKADAKVRRKFKVALACVESNVTCLDLVPLQLRENKDFIMACFDLGDKDRLNVSLIGDRLWCDADVVAKVVATATATSAALRHASPTLQDNHDIVLAAVARNGMNLQHASPRLQATRLIADTAVHSTEAALPFASQALREDVAFLIRMKLRDSDLLHPPQTAQDKTLFANRPFMMGCVRRDGSNLQHAPKALQDDVDVVLEALRSNVSAAAFASPSVLRHPRVRVFLWGHKALLAGCLIFIVCNIYRMVCKASYNGGSP